MHGQRNLRRPFLAELPSVSLSDRVDDIEFIPAHRRFGRVIGVSTLWCEVGPLPRLLAVGRHCVVAAQDGSKGERADLAGSYAHLGALLQAPA